MKAIDIPVQVPDSLFSNSEDPTLFASIIHDNHIVTVLSAYAEVYPNWRETLREVA